MTNPTPDGRRPHPLERRPAAPVKPVETPETPSLKRPRVKLDTRARRPIVTYILIAINLAVFALRTLSPELDAELYLWGANIPQAVNEGEYYRLLTSMFLHAGIYDFRGGFAFGNTIHIVFNMFILYSVGSELETLFGHLRFGLIYLLGGLMGSVFSAVFRLGGGSVGASGAVFAILGAEFIFLYRHRALLGALAQARMRSLLIWGALNLGLGALGGTLGGSLRIDNWGHLGGLIGGVALAWWIAPRYQPSPVADETAVIVASDTNPLSRRVGALLIYAILLVGILALVRLP